MDPDNKYKPDLLPQDGYVVLLREEDRMKPFLIGAGVRNNYKDSPIYGISNERIKFLQEPARYLQSEDIALLIGEYPFLEEFGGSTVFKRVRDLTLGVTAHASIFNLCIELDCLPKLQKQFLERRPPYLYEGLQLVNDFGHNIVQQAVTRGQLTNAIDFITGLYPPDQEQEIQPILAELFLKLLENSDGYYRLNAVVMAAQAGCLHEMDAVVRALLKLDRERVLSIFDSGQEYQMFNGRRNILHLLLNNDVLEESPVAADLIIEVFSGHKGRLRELLTEEDFHNQKPLDALFTKHSDSAVKILVAAYDSDPDGFKRLMDSRNLISRLSREEKFKPCLLPLYAMYLDCDASMMERLSSPVLDPRDLFLLEKPSKVNIEVLTYFLLGENVYNKLVSHLRDNSKATNTVEGLLRQTPNVLGALMRLSDDKFLLETAIINLLPRSENANTLFQMARGSLVGRFETDSKLVEAVHLRELYIPTGRGNFELDRVRGDELLINLGPTEVEAMNAYDGELTQIRKSFEILMEKVFGIRGEFYSGDRDVFDPTHPDPLGVIGRILNPRPLHGGGFAPDMDLFQDVLGTLPLSPAGQQARHLLFAGQIQDEEQDIPFRQIFPREEFPMLNKPEGGFLPIPISPEDWLEFIRRLCVHTPNLDTGSFLDFTIVRESLNNKLLELAKGSGIDPDLQDISEIDKFSRMLASYYINAIYAMDRTRILNMEEVRQRPVYIRILDPKPDSRDFFDFLRFPYAGDPSEKIRSSRPLEQTLKLYYDPEVAIAMLYENRSAIDIVAEETSRDDLGEEELSAKMDAIEYEMDTFAFGYVTISTGSMKAFSGESTDPTDSEIIILGDAELAAYRSPENVAMVLLTLARELKVKTGLPVLISSAYGKVFEREIARGVTDISTLAKDTLVQRHAGTKIGDNTGIKPKEMTRLYYSDAYPDEPTAMINNWFLIG